MRWLRQIWVVGLLGLRSLPTRAHGSLIIVSGLTIMMVVLLWFFSAEEGIKLAYLGSASASRAIVLSTGASRAVQSSIPTSSIGVIASAPGIRRGSGGMPLVDAEINTFALLTKKSNKKPGITEMRGIGPIGLEMSPEITLTDGRYYRSGTREIIVGVAARQKFSGLELGEKLALLDGGEWTVVGHFSAGSFIDGDVIADPEVMEAALRRSGYNSVLVRLEATEAFGRFESALTSDPALSLTAERETDYWERLFRTIRGNFIIAYVIGVLLASGAVSGILHTMHAAVSSRATEIAILRAIGFGGFSVSVSIVLEAMVFACIGAALGTAIDWLWFNGYPYEGAYGVFRLAITPHLLVVAITWALVTALIGAFAPAIQEAKLEVVDALGRI